MKRLIPAVVAGCLIACLAAVTLGEYPLTGTVPWLACVIVPALIGTAMTSIAGGHKKALWLVTGGLSGASLAWGVSISTSWGLDPVPAAAWAAIGIGLAWPVAWALLGGRSTPAPTAGAPAPRPNGGPATDDIQRTTSSEIRPS